MELLAVTRSEDIVIPIVAAILIFGVIWLARGVIASITSYARRRPSRDAT